ncbi:MAG TPA: hypothetical protein VEA59_07305 [Patescibacteria group bacterium]|nr:hypothetical protein [Patescibacteria group bacterium]
MNSVTHGSYSTLEYNLFSTLFASGEFSENPSYLLIIAIKIGSGANALEPTLAGRVLNKFFWFSTLAGGAHLLAHVARFSSARRSTV